MLSLDMYQIVDCTWTFDITKATLDQLHTIAIVGLISWGVYLNIANDGISAALVQLFMLDKHVEIAKQKLTFNALE